MPLRQRVSTLKMSVAGVAALFAAEGFVTEPMLPNKHDRPTICYGNTFYADGTPVKLSDAPVTKEQCLEMARIHIEKDEAAFKKAMGNAFLHQTEFDVYLDFVYQYGMGTWNSSSMSRYVKQGNYTGACRALLAYKKIRVGSGANSYLFDCSTPNNKVCRGVWTRQLERYNTCLSVQ